MRASASFAQTFALEKASTVPATAELLRNCLRFTATPRHFSPQTAQIHSRLSESLSPLPVYTPEQCEVVIQNQGSPTVVTLRPMGLFWGGRRPMTSSVGSSSVLQTTKWLDGFVSTGYGLQDFSALIFVDVGQSSLLLSSSVRPYKSCCSLQRVTKTIHCWLFLIQECAQVL
jgi:hypothetical protein